MEEQYVNRAVTAYFKQFGRGASQPCRATSSFRNGIITLVNANELKPAELFELILKEVGPDYRSRRSTREQVGWDDLRRPRGRQGMHPSSWDRYQVCIHESGHAIAALIQDDSELHHVEATGFFNGGNTHATATVWPKAVMAISGPIAQLLTLAKSVRSDKYVAWAATGDLRHAVGLINDHELPAADVVAAAVYLVSNHLDKVLKLAKRLQDLSRDKAGRLRNEFTTSMTGDEVEALLTVDDQRKAA